jgi:DNA polymerase-3 subunit gamma/tau
MMQRIAAKEGADLDEDALSLIARAAEGSARDATSLLDQAISHGAGRTTAVQVRAMLGLADRGRVLDLFDMVLKGDTAAALAELSSQYAEGADPMAVLRDLAEVTHWISVVKITPEAAEDPTVSPDERARGRTMAQDLPMRVLTRLWQMLLKALEEVSMAPNAMMAAEMAIIRMTHVADLPSPEELVRKFQDTPAPVASPAAPTPAPTRPGPAPNNAQLQQTYSGETNAYSSSGSGQNAQALAPAQQENTALARFPSFAHVVDLIRANRDVKLLVEVESCLRLARYQPGRIEFSPTDAAPPDLAQRLGQKLQDWTGTRWGVSVVGDCDAETIAEIRDAEDLALKQIATDHPLMKAVLHQFPKARITSITTPDLIAAAATEEALPEVDDEWDPFEDS